MEDVLYEDGRGDVLSADEDIPWPNVIAIKFRLGKA